MNNQKAPDIIRIAIMLLLVLVVIQGNRTKNFYPHILVFVILPN